MAIKRILQAMRYLVLATLLLVTAIPAETWAQTRSADFNSDGKVDFEDFFLFAAAFGGTDPNFDLDSDGKVGFEDFYLFAERFGRPVAETRKPEVLDIGIPVRSVNWVKLMAGRDAEGREGLYVLMGQQAQNLFVGKIDMGTGHVTQAYATPPGSNYPTASVWSRKGLLYVGAAYSGHLLCYDPRTGVLEDLGGINLPGDTFPCRTRIPTGGSGSAPTARPDWPATIPPPGRSRATAGWTTSTCIAMHGPRRTG
jgi:hypothetical protein